MPRPPARGRWQTLKSTSAASRKRIQAEVAARLRVISEPSAPPGYLSKRVLIQLDKPRSAGLVKPPPQRGTSRVERPCRTPSFEYRVLVRACPNMGECWNHRTATFLILGTSVPGLGFCAVRRGALKSIMTSSPVAEACAASTCDISSSPRQPRRPSDGGAESSR